MVFQVHTPAKALQPFIQCYLEADYTHSHQAVAHTLFPNGLSGIFFNFGNMGKLAIKEEHETPLVSVFGQIDRYFSITDQPGFYSLGVLFKPTVLSKLLRVDMAEFTNRAFDGQLINRALKSLHHQIAETFSTPRKIELLEHFFMKQLQGLPHHTLTDKALHLLELHGHLPIASVAHRLGVSERYLETQFKRSIGLTPKTYSLILRFKRMEQHLKKLSIVHWQDMTFANEYYDQNHFIKDFKRFTGLTPSHYLLESFEMGRSYLMAR